jgi:hypothetical protein
METPISDAQLGRHSRSLSEVDRLRYSQKFSIIQTLLSVVQPAAAIYSLIGTAKLNGLDPEAYVRQVLERLVDHPVNHIEQTTVVERRWSRRSSQFVTPSSFSCCCWANRCAIACYQQ